MSEVRKTQTLMSRDQSSPPPSYEELYPGTGDCYKCYNDAEASLIRERLGGVNIPQRYVDMMTRDPPPYSTYFTRTQFRYVTAFFVQIKVIRLFVFRSGDSGVYWGELDWKGRRAGSGVMVWQEDRDSVQVYSGSWAKDRPEGRGEMWWGAGRGAVYTGEWAAGKQHGPGVIRRGDTEIRANFRSDTFTQLASVRLCLTS